MHDELPDDIRDLAARLEVLGEQERCEAEIPCRRVAMQTAPLLQPRSGAGVSPASESFRRFLLWFGTPALAAAAVLLLVLVLSPKSPTVHEERGTEVLAASIESDIDTWFALDAMWVDDSFESTLTALTIDTAGLASESAEGAASLETYPALEGDL